MRANERMSLSMTIKTSYIVTMDLDGDGDLDTKTIPLPDGVEFDTVETIAFDWRGRTWNTVGALTMSNAQVSIRLKNEHWHGFSRRYRLRRRHDRQQSF